VKRFRRLAALLALILIAPAPQAAPESRLYAPGSFDRLDVEGSAEIRLVQGERDQVLVIGGDEVQQALEIRHTGNRLRISPGGNWKFWNSARPVIEVQMRQPAHLVLSGSSDLHAPGLVKGDQLTISISGSGLARFDDLKVGRLRFDISGAGDGQLNGQADTLLLSVSGKGRVQAEQLQAKAATVSISGVGNASLWVTDSLHVNISGVGNVEYWGQPAVKRLTSGVGSLTSRGDKAAR
jgi:Putative auto-transporter adhesin, head GIN domain